MNDPDLYVPNKEKFLSPPREKAEIPFTTRTASRFKCEQTQQRTPPTTFQLQPQHHIQQQPLTQGHPLHAKQRPSFGRQGSGSGHGGQNFMTSDDIQLKADPLRVSKMPELIRINSSKVLSSTEEIEQQHEQESEHFERRSHAHHSIVQKSLVITKTKQQSNFSLISPFLLSNLSK